MMAGKMGGCDASGMVLDIPPCNLLFFYCGRITEQEIHPLNKFLHVGTALSATGSWPLSRSLDFIHLRELLPPPNLAPAILLPAAGSLAISDTSY